MLVRQISPGEKEKYNQVVKHFIQSYQWGEFREKTGVEVIRLGVFGPSTSSGLKAGYQLTVHSIPHLPYTVLYLPKGPLPDDFMLATLLKIGQEKNAIFIKLEPDVEVAETKYQIPVNRNLVLSPRPLFTKYTFQIDLTKSEKELMSQMKEKTRYNVRLAQKHGVKVLEDNSPEAFEIYLRLLAETTTRQKFYAHNEDYHRKMWEIFAPSGFVHLLLAYYQEKPLVAWILFRFRETLYYPYGASSAEHREVMASNLIMWEAIKLGKKLGCQIFDLWGCLGPNPSPADPWYGFHRFKEGYGGKLVEFIGTYDLVINPLLYRIYNFVDNLRWSFLRLKLRLSL